MLQHYLLDDLFDWTPMKTEERQRKLSWTFGIVRAVLRVCITTGAASRSGGQRHLFARREALQLVNPGSNDCARARAPIVVHRMSRVDSACGHALLQLFLPVEDHLNCGAMARSGASRVPCRRRTARKSRGLPRRIETPRVYCPTTRPGKRRFPPNVRRCMAVVPDRSYL